MTDQERISKLKQDNAQLRRKIEHLEPLTATPQVARPSHFHRTGEWCLVHLTPEERVPLSYANAVCDIFRVPVALCDAVDMRERVNHD